MSRSDDDRPAPAADLRGWLALAWATAFGLLYAAMMLRAKLPGLLDRFLPGG